LKAAQKAALQAASVSKNELDLKYQSDLQQRAVTAQSDNAKAKSEMQISIRKFNELLDGKDKEIIALVEDHTKLQMD